MKPSAAAAAALVFAAFAAPAGQQARFQVEPDQVLLTVQAALGSKQISGVSRALVASVEEAAGGGLRIVARAPVASFESGNAALDGLFARLADADQFPTVEFEGRAPLARRSGQFTVQLEGTISVHGVARPIAAPVRVLRDGKTLFVKTAFQLDLGQFGLTSPSIAGVTVSSQVQVEVHALLGPAQATAQLAGSNTRG